MEWDVQTLIIKNIIFPKDFAKFLMLGWGDRPTYRLNINHVESSGALLCQYVLCSASTTLKLSYTSAVALHFGFHVIRWSLSTVACLCWMWVSRCASQINHWWLYFSHITTHANIFSMINQPMWFSLNALWSCEEVDSYRLCKPADPLCNKTVKVGQNTDIGASGSWSECS